jgi:hypothetical protein
MKFKVPAPAFYSWSYMKIMRPMPSQSRVTAKVSEAVYTLVRKATSLSREAFVFGS